MEGFHHIRHQLMLKSKIIAGAHGSQHFPVDDDLAADIVGRFEEDRVHAYIRCDASRFRLHDLCASHLHAIGGNKGVECHIL